MSVSLAKSRTLTAGPIITAKINREFGFTPAQDRLADRNDLRELQQYYREQRISGRM